MINTDYNILIKDIERISLIVNEQKDGVKQLNLLKNKIKNYLTHIPTSKIYETLPSIITTIKKSFTAKNFKFILLFIIPILINQGFDLMDIKTIYKDNKVYDYVEWNSFDNIETNIDTSNLKYNYEIGEYVIDSNYFNKVLLEITKNINKNDTIILNGDLYVSISLEDNDYSNYANDDTINDKKVGGQLIQKRRKFVKDFIYKLKLKLNETGYNVDLNFNIISKRGLGRIFKFDTIKVIKQNVDQSILTNDVYKQNDINNNTDIMTPISGGDGHKDISNLSKNYQYVELLKIANIYTDRTEGDKRINPYADWIIDTRKHPERMMRRLQIEYPEYNIEFKTDGKSFNSVSGTQKGMSNMKNQYQYVGENQILKYIDFINENIENNILSVWKKIMGNKFPNLTIEQAELFDENIETFLDYLQQMYSMSKYEFKYKLN